MGGRGTTKAAIVADKLMKQFCNTDASQKEVAEMEGDVARREEGGGKTREARGEREVRRMRGREKHRRMWGYFR